MLWHEFQNIENNESNQLVACVCVSPDSPWFDGHFPGEPVLPGIAQLGIVSETISRFSDAPVEIESIDRIRFKKLIRPGDDLNISVAPRKDHARSYAFRIMLKAEVVCSGSITVK